ncbi:MAG: DUF885 family protein [Caulobacteraceae bacterium]|nr:DUF885 family protein [Caulobacteraceae bacterium]
MGADRRHFLMGAAATGAALAAGPALAARTKAGPKAGPKGDPALHRLLDAFADEILDEAPEAATSLGLDNGRRAALKSRLSDRSWTAVEKGAQACADRLGRLKALERSRLGGQDLVYYDSMLYALQMGLEGARFAFGDNAFDTVVAEGTTPYVVSQQTGVFTSLPEFLNSQHKIATRADCDAYLARVEAFAKALDQETDRVRRDAGAGVVAPDFILKTTLDQMTEYRGQKAAETGLVKSLAERAKAKGIAGDWAGQAAALVSDKVFPALDRQIAEVKAAQAKARHDAGVWKLPDGEAYYAWLLKVGTTTALNADDIHKMGLEQNRAIESRMDALLKAQGLTQGTVGERMQALTRDPRFLFPNTDAGKAQVIEYLNGRIAALRPLLPKMSRLSLKAPVLVKRVPVDIEAGASLGYMNFPSLDGSRPAIYYINLKDTALWPKWTLPTLTAHETIPGHAWQGAYLAEHHAELPLITAMMGFNANVEGWALYAEQMADELGYYKDDPYGRLGYLQALQFRACRLVVDTGLHAKRWTREQAVEFLVAKTGRAQGAMTSEVDRYCSTPGQACGYKVGHTELLRLRDKAKAALGARYDLRDFDDAVITAGSVPMDVMATVVDRYIAAKAGKKA